MAISIPPDVRKDLIRSTVKDSAVQNIIKLMSRRSRPVSTPEVREAVGVKNISDTARKANKRLKAHGLAIQCVKTGRARDAYGWVVAES